MAPLLLWVGVFVATMVADIFWAKYFLAVTARRPLAAASWSALIAAFGCYTTIEYVQYIWLFSAAVAGAFVGTWITVRKAA